MSDEHIKFSLGADTSAAERAMMGFDGQVKHLVGEWGAKLGAALGLGAIIERFHELGRAAMENALQLHHQAEMTGASVEFLQAWGKMASRAGVEAEVASKGIEKFNISIGDAAEGGDKAKVFERLGISIRNASGEIRPTDDLLKEFADKLKDIPEPAVRARFAFELLGKSGAELVPILQDGGKAIDEFQKKASKKFLNEQDIEGLLALRRRLNQAGDVGKNVAGKGLAVVGTFLDINGIARRGQEKAFQRGEKRALDENLKYVEERYKESGKSISAFYDSITDAEEKSMFYAKHGEDIDKERQELAKVQVELNKARADQEMRSADAEMKVLLNQRAVEVLEGKIAATKEGSVDRAKLEIELAKKKGDLQESIKNRDDEIQKKKEKADQDEKKHLDDVKKKTEEIAKASEKTADARGKLSEARANFDTMSISDIAQLNVRGQSFNARKQIFAARQVEQLDQAIRQARLSSSGTKEDNDYINQLIDRRKDLAKGIFAASENERNPFKSLEDAIKDAVKNEELVKMAKSGGIPVNPTYSQ